MKNTVLAVLQAILVLYIVFISGEFYYFSVPFIAMLLVSLLLIFWAILGKKVYAHKISKKETGKIYFLKEGPYEFIRFPIYAGILLFVLAYVQDNLTIIRGIAFLLFAATILIRVKDDEILNEKHFKHEYKEYQKYTKKIIPYLY